MATSPHITVPPSFGQTISLNANFKIGSALLQPVFGTSPGQIPNAGSTVLTSRQVLAGSGLTGGGNLGSDVTLALDATLSAGASAGATALQPGDTGTSGHKLGYLDGANTISAAWSFTTAPTVPTQTTGDNTTKAANTAFVAAAIAALVNSSPSTLDTLKELADALGDDPNFSTTMATALGTKAASARVITAGTGLTGGGDLTADRTLALAAIADARLMGNISGGSAAPTPSSLSAILDALVSSTPGAHVRRAASAWKAAQAYSFQVPTTGFAITIPNDTGSLLLNPATTLLAGAVTMPAAPEDGDIVRIASTQQVTALTVSANTGQTIADAPTTIAAGGGVAFQYVASSTLWVRLY